MKTIVGAYATAPAFDDEAGFRRYVDRVLALPRVDGLEIPYFLHEDSLWKTLPYLSGSPLGSRHVLTLLPAMMSGMATTRTFGLASRDEEGRVAALDVVRHARRFVADANAAGGGSFAAIELHSAPLRSSGSGEALARSLRDISAWDWEGVRINVEHCDALTDTPPAKGFLSLGDELDAAAPHNVGMVINWARSAIETRSVNGPRDHIALSRARDSLTGVVFSGCANVDTVYGTAWQDSHLPMSGWAGGKLAATSSASLLSRDELNYCLTLALPGFELDFVGVKVCAPPDANEQERFSLIAGNLDMLTSSIDRVCRQAGIG